MAIPTVEEAATKLQGMLAQITPGLDPAGRSRISDELMSFANPASSYAVPAEGAYMELREAALTTSAELDRALSAAAMARIRARSAALTRYVAGIKAVTTEAENRANALKLTVVKEVLASSKTIMDAAKEAKNAFKEGRTDAGYAAIEKVIDELEALGPKLPV